MKKRLFAVFAAALVGASVVAPLSVFADDSSTRTWLPDQWAQLFPVVQGQYLGADLQYHDCEFRYYGGAAPVSLEDSIASGDVSMLGRTCVNYRAYLPDSDVPIQAYYNSAALYDAKFIMNFDFTFVNCNYVSMGFFGYIYPRSELNAYYVGQPLLFSNAESNQWNYSGGSIQSAINQTGGMRGISWSSAQNFQGLGGIATISHSPGNLHFGTLTIATVGSNTAADGSFFGVVLPITNQDASIVIGNPDSGDDDETTNINGSLDGSITPNESSGYDVNVNVNVNVPDYNGKLDSIESAINPSYDSSGIDSMQTAIGSAVAQEDSLLDAAGSNLDSLPSDLEFDDSIIDEAVGNPFETFFNENIIGIMIFWVGSIAFISYILFGKWV